MKAYKRSLAVLACAAAGMAAPANAMGCWNHEQVDAAKVRDLQSRLMVAALRCHAMGFDVSRAYNSFVGANETTLKGANGVLKAHFASNYGSAGPAEYDRFATALANHYGDESTSGRLCGAVRETAYEAADAAGDARTLIAINERLGVTMEVPGGQCDVSFADARVVKAETPAPVAQTEVRVEENDEVVVTVRRVEEEPRHEAYDREERDDRYGRYEREDDWGDTQDAADDGWISHR